MAGSWAGAGDIGAGEPKIYSVPRRYDLATLFAISAAYAVLFGAMRLFGFHPLVFGIVAGFLTFVAIAQALLFKGKAPRAASVLAGVVFVVGFALIQTRGYSIEQVIPGTMCAAIGGAILGYMAGVFVGAVFLLAHVGRKIAARLDGYRQVP